MVKIYFRSALRQLLKHSYYTFLTIAGLGLAIACSLFIYSYNSFQYSFDQFHTDKERTFLVVQDLKLEQVEHSKGGSYAMYNAISREIPQVERTALYMDNKDLTLRIADQLYKTEGKAAFVSSEYFNTLNFPWLAGSPKDLDQPNTVALTKTMAKTYFNNDNPLGKTILVDSKFPVKVVGIIDDRNKNSDFRSEIYFSQSSVSTLWQIPQSDGFFNNWGYSNSSNNILVTLKNAADKNTVEQAIHALVAKYWHKDVLQTFSYKLLPLTSYHFDTDYGKGTQRTLLSILVAIAIGVSIMALVNYSNITFARQMNRSVEMGVRKVLGCSKRQLYIQFLIETLILTAAAIIFALVLLLIFSNWANQALFPHEPVQIVRPRSFIAIIGIIWILTSLLTSIYPLIFVNKMDIQQALKKLTIGPWNFSRKTLIVFQNMIAMTLLIATFVIVLQVNHLKNTDIGFSREQVILLPFTKKMIQSKAKIAHFISNRTDVQSYTFSDNPPSSEKVWGGTIQFDNRTEWEKWPARYAIGDSAYISTFNIKLLAGKNFNDNPQKPEFLINQNMATALGYKDPNDIIGKSLNAGGLNEEQVGTIVGVVADFSTNSLNEPISPTVIGYNETRLKNVAIKLKGTDHQLLVKDLEQQWKNWYPDEVFQYKFYDQQIAQLYKKEALLEKLIWIAAIVAISISMLGFLGLLSINILKRTKEIGIRKVLGSSVTGIIVLLSQDFFKWITIAFVLATPLAYYLMNRWLDNFPFRISMGWWIFASAFCVGLMLTIAVVSLQAIKAATANPVDSLRDE